MTTLLTVRLSKRLTLALAVLAVGAVADVDPVRALGLFGLSANGVLIHLTVLLRRENQLRRNDLRRTQA
jgi:hypothetical protein